MRSTFKILFYINRAKVKSDGTTSIFCRISIDGKQAVFSTDIYCRPEDWNAKKGIIKAEKDNNRLAAFRSRIEHTYEHILKYRGVISSELLKNTIIGVNSISTLLLETGKVEIERLRIRSKEINSKSTYRNSRLSQSNLQEFLLSRGMEDIAFSDITEEFGESFKSYLKTVRDRKPGYINKSFTWLNSLIYIAIDREVLRSNPLEAVRFEKREPVKHRHINKQDLKRIMESPIKDARMELVRRAFIFSSLTGLAYADIHSLYPHHLGKTAEGRPYIRKQRTKTGVEAFIPLHPIAGQILSLYNTTDNDRPVFPLPCRSSIWYDLNEIGVTMGLKENLSYHVARHSFGTLALSAGLSIESTAKMMGHTNISTTQGYAEIMEKKISEDMDKLIERRKRKGTNP